MAKIDSRLRASAIGLFAIDVDGTLLDSSHQLRPEVGDSVCRLAASGIQVVLATARSPQAVSKIVQQFGFCPWLICFSGAWIGKLDPRSFKPSDIQFDRRMPAADARSVLEAALAHQVGPNVFTPEDWRVGAINEEILQESKIVDLQPSIVTELLAEGEGVNKIMLVSSLDRAGQVLPLIAESIRSFCTATFSKPNYLEVLPLGVNKATALAMLSGSLNIELDQVAAIGDGLNDLEMLSEVGLPIAMGNAVEDLKAKAVWVVGTNDGGGVAEAIERLLRERRWRAK